MLAPVENGLCLVCGVNKFAFLTVVGMFEGRFRVVLAKLVEPFGLLTLVDTGNLLVNMVLDII